MALSRYQAFTRGEWARLRADTPLTLTEDDLAHLRGLNDRVSQRLGLAKSEDPNEIHDQLVAILPKGRLTQGTHLLITHGRRTCVARKPACPVCPVRALCPWPDKTRA